MLTNHYLGSLESSRGADDLILEDCFSFVAIPVWALVPDLLLFQDLIAALAIILLIGQETS